ncbi:MAG: hypothetical protein ACOYEG_08540 [Petrimonas sp.]
MCKIPERYDFHNRRSTTCGKRAPHNPARSGDTGEVSVPPYRRIFDCFFTVSRRFTLSYGYGNQALQALLENKLSPI